MVRPSFSILKELLFAIGGLTLFCSLIAYFIYQNYNAPCSSGSYHENSFWCSKCPPGSFCPGDSHSHLCPEATFSPRSGSTFCKWCPDGYSSQIGAASCYQCPPGHFSSKQTNHKCTLCPNAKITEDTEDGYCVDCGYEKFCIIRPGYVESQMLVGIIAVGVLAALSYWLYKTKIAAPPIKLGQQCMICWEGRAEFAFIPCGHKILCGGCARKFTTRRQKCPVCRAECKYICKIYGGAPEENQ